MEGKGDVYLSMLYVGDLLTVAVMIFESHVLIHFSHKNSQALTLLL